MNVSYRLTVLRGVCLLTRGGATARFEEVGYIAHGIQISNEQGSLPPLGSVQDFGRCGKQLRTIKIKCSCYCFFLKLFENYKVEHGVTSFNRNVLHQR